MAETVKDGILETIGGILKLAKENGTRQIDIDLSRVSSGYGGGFIMVAEFSKTERKQNEY